MIQLQTRNAKPFVKKHEIDQLKTQIEQAKIALIDKSGAGNDYVGWVHLPNCINADEVKKIEHAANKIKADSDVLVVIGIGGSYLGARAVIELLSNHFSALLSKEERKCPLVLFAGHQISSTYLAELIAILDRYEVSLNVISKSGTTTEPAVAFRFLKKYMEDRYGKEVAKNRIYCTTDKKRGALKSLADQEGYETFVVPDDVGGRYSVLTPVGLLPIAVSGISISELLAGAKEMYETVKSTPYESNVALQYVAFRNALYRKGYTTEVLVNYEPSFHYMTEWWKQLYGESEGKDQRGIFPAGVDFSTDLHSMGQYLQDGKRMLFETVVFAKQPRQGLSVPNDPANMDGLNFLSGKCMSEVNQNAMEGTVLAHVDGGVPNLILLLEEFSAKTCGALIYFFEFACGVSGYVNAINPFDQPGVEMYKKNMYALLGKPGFEEAGKLLKEKLNENN